MELGSEWSPLESGFWLGVCHLKETPTLGPICLIWTVCNFVPVCLIFCAIYFTVATFYFYVSHGSATRFIRNGKKYYICFIDNLLLFPTVKEFSKSVSS